MIADEAVFNRREFRYGVDGRANTGVGLWQLAYASNTDLAIRPTTAPRALRCARSRPMRDSRLAHCRAAAASTCWCRRRSKKSRASLLNSEFMAGAGASASVATSNIWRNSADLIVSEFLA